MGTAISGRKAVTTAGTAEAGPSTPRGTYLIRFDPQATGYGYIGNDGAGDVTTSNGLKMAAGDQYVVCVSSLAVLRFDVSVSGEAFSYARMWGDESNYSKLVADDI